MPEKQYNLSWNSQDGLGYRPVGGEGMAVPADQSSHKYIEQPIQSWNSKDGYDVVEVGGEKTPIPQEYSGIQNNSGKVVRHLQGKENFLDKLVDLTPQYVRDHPWAVGLGTVATVGALIAAYALWKKKKGESTAAVEEMCVLYPLLNKYSKSLSESYSFDNYNSYINASKRMDKVAPVVYNMMISEAGEWTPTSSTPSGNLTPAEMSARENGTLFSKDLDDVYNGTYGSAGNDADTGIIAEILNWFKSTGNKAVEAFLNSYNITADWIKEHPGMAGAAALAAILGTYGVYKLIKIYKEAKENGEVNAKELEESIDMLRKFRAVCESSCNPYITETQKYKNITLLCNLIDSDL